MDSLDAKLELAELGMKLNCQREESERLLRSVRDDAVMWKLCFLELFKVAATLAETIKGDIEDWDESYPAWTAFVDHLAWKRSLYEEWVLPKS